MPAIRLLLAAILLFALGAQGRAADYLGRTLVYEAGKCSETRVLGHITRRFDHQVRNVPNLPHVAITDFLEIGLNRYEPARQDSPIARHYCHARARMTDGYVRSVWFLIEEGMGFASIGDNVEFCVAGFDRWLVYNSPWCRVLR